MLQDIG